MDSIGVLGVGFLAFACGAVSGEAFGRYSDAVLFGNGYAIRTVMGDKFWLIVMFFVLLVSLAYVTAGEHYEVAGIILKPWWAIVIAYVCGFVPISDLRCNLIPEFLTVPLIVTGIAHGWQTQQGLQQAVLPVLAIFSIRYALGLSVVAGLVATKSQSQCRMYALTKEGDWALIAGFSAWVGSENAVGLVVLTFALIALTEVSTKIPVIGGAIRSACEQAKRGLYSATEIPYDPDVKPIGGIIVLAFVMQLAIVALSHGQIRPQSLVNYIFHGIGLPSSGAIK